MEVRKMPEWQGTERKERFMELKRKPLRFTKPDIGTSPHNTLFPSESKRGFLKICIWNFHRWISCKNRAAFDCEISFADSKLTKKYPMQ